LRSCGIDEAGGEAVWVLVDDGKMKCEEKKEERRVHERRVGDGGRCIRFRSLPRSSSHIQHTDHFELAVASWLQNLKRERTKGIRRKMPEHY
jgi:hypothetical protein